jgi:hypothetical protein
MEFLLTGNQENMKYMNKLKTGHSDFKCLLHVFHDFMFSCQNSSSFPSNFSI